MFADEFAADQTADRGVDGLGVELEVGGEFTFGARFGELRKNGPDFGGEFNAVDAGGEVVAANVAIGETGGAGGGRGGGGRCFHDGRADERAAKR